MPKKTLSLSNELHLIMDAVGGVQRQVRHVIDDYAADDPDALAGIDAMLVVLRERLRLLDRAVRGTLDPRLVWCAESDADLSPGDPAEDDVRLKAWSDGKLAGHHRREKKRATSRLP
jgi:hypothetical protein